MTKDPIDMTHEEILEWARGTFRPIYLDHPNNPAFLQLKASHCGKDGKYRTRHACKPTRRVK